MTDPAPAATAATGPTTTSRHLGSAAWLVLAVVTLATTLTWCFLSMRAVLDVGGTCASGGPYLTAHPCPSGADMMAWAIPLMLVATLGGSVAAAMVSAPNLLVPMWAFLFGFLGYNFLDFAFGSGLTFSWLVCGIMFELFALPALAFIWVGIRDSISPPPGKAPVHAATRWWFAAYVVLGWAGIALGWWSYHALS
jgi:hypothetical protein